MNRVTLLVVALVLAGVSVVHAAGDPAKGKQQFTVQCSVCHATTSDGADKALGPNLLAVMGKKAGSNRLGFTYSDALKNSGVVWTDDNMDAWLKNPAQLVPGNKMPFVGIGEEDARADLIAYLKQLLPGADASARSSAPAGPALLVRGTVTDAVGKNIPGATVKFIAPRKAVSVFSGEDGRYKILLPAGSYQVEAKKYGYAPLQQEMQVRRSETLDFKLEDGWNVLTLTGADIEYLLPNDPASEMVKVECRNCHALSQAVRASRGWRAEQWLAFLPQMSARMGYHRFMFSEGKMNLIAQRLEAWFGPNAKYFGPNARMPTRAQVRHPKVDPDVYQATFKEYKLPDYQQTMPHSVSADGEGEVWIAGNDSKTNAIIRFAPSSETFKTYPLRAGSIPHTPCSTRDGMAWMANGGRTPSKLASVDPKTDKVTEYEWNDKLYGTHICREDLDGNLWLPALGDPKEPFYVFERKTGKFRAYAIPVPETYPPRSYRLKATFEGDPKPQFVHGGLYDAVVDSKNRVWGVTFNLGMIVMLDPRSGETKQYFPPGIDSILGATIDADDNVWFGAYDQHKLGKLDTKTGKFTFYQPPTLAGGPYGFTYDRERNFIWFCDLPGNNITRFDPKTEKFTEYPIPTHSAGGGRLGIGIDPEGRVWFSEYFNGSIGVIDPGYDRKTPSWAEAS